MSLLTNEWPAIRRLFIPPNQTIGKGCRKKIGIHRKKMRTIQPTKPAQLRVNYWKRGIGLVLLALVAGGLASCYTQRAASTARLEAEITEEFEVAVKPACEDFQEEIRGASEHLRNDVATGFDDISNHFVELCLSSDGYLERTKGTEEAQRKLADYMRAAVTDLLNDSLEGFSQRYSRSLDLLEGRLLVKSGIDTSYLKVQRHSEVLIKNYAPSPNADDIRGSSTIKLVDEAAGWIPFLGDAYEVAKLALGDPRENGIKSRASDYAAEHQRYWLGVINDVMATLPSAEEAEQACRKNFNARVALKLLEAK